MAKKFIKGPQMHLQELYLRAFPVLIFFNKFLNFLRSSYNFFQQINDMIMAMKRIDDMIVE